MTDPVQQITDEQLHAYVDGHLDAAGRQAVERHLASNPDAAAQVKSWQAINVGLQRLGGTLVPDPNRTLAWKHGAPDDLAEHRERRRPYMAALRVISVAATLTIGVFGGWYAHDRLQPKSEDLFARQAAAAYKVFASPVQARPVEMSGEERERLERWLSHPMSVGFRMKVPQLEAEGWTLVGGRLLSNVSGPAALYVYEKKAQGAPASEKPARIALYVVATQQAMEKPLSWPQGFPVEICDWSNDRLHMALAGPVDRDQMKKLLGPINTQVIAQDGAVSDPVAAGIPELPVPRTLVSLNPRR